MKKNNYVYFVIIGLVLVIVLDNLQLYQLKKLNMVFIRVGERVLILPNDYYVDTTLPNETNFHGEKGNVIISHTVPPGFLEYIEKNLKKTSELCGMKMYEGNAEGMRSILLFDGIRYVYFINVPSAVETTALEALCKRGQKRG